MLIRHTIASLLIRCALPWFLAMPLAAFSFSDDRVDFDTQVIPILTRQGCNAGACHGAAIGRGGFKLSLFGSGAGSDYDAIVRALKGRRVNVTDPELSLLLRKPSEAIEHGGGVRLEHGSDAYELVQHWIEQGAYRVQSRQLTDLTIEPRQALLDRCGVAIAIRVTATFDDGTVEDVTEWTTLSSDDPESVVIDPDASQLVVKRRGEHVVMARFLDRVEPIRVGVPFADQPWSDQESQEFMAADPRMVDRHVDAQLRRLRIRPSAAADDHEFARRLWLDLAGRLPTPEELREFVNDRESEKRTRTVDRLLATDEFADYWALKWANVLAIDSEQLQPAGAAAYHNWIASRLRIDAPWDETVHQLVTTTGDGHASGPVNFSRTGKGPDGLAEYATQVLMGVRLRCANCHNHPFDHWEQDDYHGLAAIFAKLNRGRVVTVSSRGEVTHPVTGMPAIPRIPGSRFLSPEADGRQAFADWLIDPDNPYLARAAVNRIWSQLMGRGLIEPVDDIRSTNPASHPDLLEELTRDFIGHGYQFKHVIRQICRSQAYQRSARSLAENAGDTVYYSHFLARPLEAEVIADAIADVTGVPMTFGESNSSSAIQLTNNRLDSVSLDLLGRCDRAMSCEDAGATTGSLARTLHFLNGPLLNDPLSAEDCILTSWLDRADDANVLEQVYLKTLSRPIRVDEQEFWNEQLVRAGAGDSGWDRSASRRMFFEDLLWSLMTSEPFLTNH